MTTKGLFMALASMAAIRGAGPVRCSLPTVSGNGGLGQSHPESRFGHARRV